MLIPRTDLTWQWCCIEMYNSSLTQTHRHTRAPLWIQWQICIMCAWECQAANNESECCCLGVWWAEVRDRKRIVRSTNRLCCNADILFCWMLISSRFTKTAAQMQGPLLVLPKRKSTRNSSFKPCSSRAQLVQCMALNACHQFVLSYKIL